MTSVVSVVRTPIFGHLLGRRPHLLNDLFSFFNSHLKDFLPFFYLKMDRSLELPSIEHLASVQYIIYSMIQSLIFQVNCFDSSYILLSNAFILVLHYSPFKVLSFLSLVKHMT